MYCTMDAMSLISILANYNPLAMLGKGFSKLPEIGGYAYGLLSDPNGSMQAMSDKYLGTHYGQSEMMQEQGQINSKLAQAERSWQEQMIAADRAYNSPSNQMKLLREAGLNPSLMYGQMSDIGGNAPNAGAASVGLGQPQYSAVPAASLLSAQVENLNANTMKTFAEIPKVNQETALLKQKCSEVLANIQLLKESALAKHEEFNKFLNENNFFIETWASRSDLINADAAKARLEVRTFREQFEKNMSQADATIRYLIGLTDLNEQQKDNLKSAYDILQSQKRVIEKQAELVEKYGNAKELIGMITQGISAVSNLVMAIGSLMPDVNISASKSGWSNVSIGQ